MNNLQNNLIFLKVTKKFQKKKIFDIQILFDILTNLSCALNNRAFVKFRQNLITGIKKN